MFKGKFLIVFNWTIFYSFEIVTNTFWCFHETEDGSKGCGGTITPMSQWEDNAAIEWFIHPVTSRLQIGTSRGLVSCGGHTLKNLPCKGEEEYGLIFYLVWVPGFEFILFHFVVCIISNPDKNVSTIIICSWNRFVMVMMFSA